MRSKKIILIHNVIKVTDIEVNEEMGENRVKYE